jgi:5-methyltetrahydropteroyltriglutamate--homocysteine methyltransferase
LTWQDHFRPFDHIVDGLETDTLTRFLGTNTFYRRPDVTEPTLDRDGLASFSEHVPDLGAASGLFTLPSPTAWVTAARDEDNNYPDPELAQTLAEEIYPTVLDRVEAHADTVVFADPWLAKHPDPTSLQQGLTAGVDAVEDATVLLQLAFQDAEPAIEAGLAETVDGVVVDLQRSDDRVLEALPADTAAGLGLVDARSSLVERTDLLVSSVDRAAQRVDSDELYLAPNGSLQHVPEPIARRKIRRLGEAARQARSKLGGEA